MQRKGFKKFGNTGIGHKKYIWLEFLELENQTIIVHNITLEDKSHTCSNAIIDTPSRNIHIGTS